MRYIKSVLLCLLLIVSLVACSKQGNFKTYNNPDVGLVLTYPSTWREINNSVTKKNIEQVKSKTDFSQETMDAVQEAMPNVILKLARPANINGVNHNPNINVFAFKLEKQDWAQLNLDNILQDQFADITKSLPNVKVTKHAFPLTGYPTIHNYMTVLTLKDRVVNQYQYFYAHPPYFVQMVFSYSHPSFEQEVKNIIRSMQITSDNNYQDAAEQKFRK